MRESSGEGWNAVVINGVRFMCNEVSSGLGFVAELELIWWRDNVELGPDERRRGYDGWKEREVIADYIMS